MNSHTCNIYISQLSIIVVHMNSTSTKPYMFFRIDFLLNFIPHHEQFFLFFFMSVLQKFNRKKKQQETKLQQIRKEIWLSICSQLSVIHRLVNTLKDLGETCGCSRVESINTSLGTQDGDI